MPFRFHKGFGGAKVAALALTTTMVFTGSATAETAFSATQETVLEAFDDYTGFAPYDAGIILPEQITPDVIDNFTFIDTRTAEEFETGTIDGATHIEWREVFARIDEVPTDKKVVLFCNTGALSAQATFGLRALGYENVLILQTGFHGWQAHRASLDN